MGQYIVSARKYRPNTFDSVVGQQTITNTLKNAIKTDQLAQAFLFCGPRGIGKTTCARILAKTINCENLTQEINPCNECKSCKAFNNSASFNIYELDAASNNSVEDIRNLVDQVRIPPQYGKYKIYIIDEVHMLSSAAFNAFLKTLEEPPSYVKFILATTEKHKIIPTILSRCQIFDFKRITVKDIAKHLIQIAEKENIQYDENALHIIAEKSDGALRDALSIFDKIAGFSNRNITYESVIENLNILDYDYYFKIVSQILKKETRNILITIHEIFEKGFDPHHFIVGLGEHLRSLLIGKDPETISLLETAPSVKEKYIEQASVCDVSFLMEALQIQNKCDVDYNASTNKKLLIELTVLQMCGLIGKQHQVEKNNFILPEITKQKPAEKNVQNTQKTEHKKPGNEHNIQKDITTKKTTRAIEKTPSIKDFTIEDQYNKKASNTESPIVEENTENRYFSIEQLEKVWYEFSLKFVSSNPSIYNLFQIKKPVLSDQNKIILTLDNEVHETYINENKTDLLKFLKDKLHNNLITLETHVKKANEIQKKAYTSKEKYQEMVQKNPHLEKLVQRLNLNLEF